MSIKTRHKVLTQLQCLHYPLLKAQGVNSRTSPDSSEPLLESSLAFLQSLLHLLPILGHNFFLESGPPS